ncbi:MAG TPA: alpha-E domain-containing protein [Acidobacteriaceae bacterium]
MLSRVADSLYWMSRYLERAEHTVRVLDVNFGMTLDPSSTSEEGLWKRALAALGNPAGLEWNGDFYSLVRALTYDADIPASVTACIAAARENARQVREEISSEQWQQLNRMYHRVTDKSEGSASRLEDFFPATLDGLHLFEGVTDTTMSHGEGWQFIQVGRSIERASSIATLLGVFDLETAHEGPVEIAGSHQFLEWIGLLRCCSAFEAYCNVYTADLTQPQILEFLLLNKEFPHSVRYSVDQLRWALDALQQESGRLVAQELSRVAGRLQASLNFCEISEVMAQGVGEYLQNISSQCRQVHTLLYRDYIHYSVQTALSK